MNIWLAIIFFSGVAFYGCGKEGSDNKRDNGKQPPPSVSDDSTAAPGEDPLPEIQNEIINETSSNEEPAPVTTATRIDDISGDLPKARVCKTFIAPDGKLGKYGKLIAANILDVDLPGMNKKYNFLKNERNYYLDSSRDAFSTRGNFLSYCPKFDSLVDEDKAFVWAWFYGALAHQESSCNETSVGSGGSPIGLLQLDKYSGRYWRGGPCADQNADMKNGFDNVSCGLWIMKDMIKGKLYGDQSILGDGGYWEPLYYHWSQRWGDYFPPEKCL